jgi:hypothetical protein
MCGSIQRPRDIDAMLRTLVRTIFLSLFSWVVSLAISLRATACSTMPGFGPCYVGCRRFRQMRQVLSKKFESSPEWKAQCTGGIVFRIDKEVGEQRIRLAVSGEISPACIDVVETCCEQAVKDGKAVHLILDVTTIDERGRALLQRLAGKGVRLSAKGIYHSYLVDTIRRTVSHDVKPAR